MIINCFKWRKETGIRGEKKCSKINGLHNCACKLYSRKITLTKGLLLSTVRIGMRIVIRTKHNFSYHVRYHTEHFEREAGGERPRLFPRPGQGRKEADHPLLKEIPKGKGKHWWLQKTFSIPFRKTGKVRIIQNFWDKIKSRLNAFCALQRGKRLPDILVHGLQGCRSKKSWYGIYQVRHWCFQALLPVQPQLHLRLRNALGSQWYVCSNMANPEVPVILSWASYTPPARIGVSCDNNVLTCPLCLNWTGLLHIALSKFHTCIINIKFRQITHFNEVYNFALNVNPSNSRTFKRKYQKNITAPFPILASNIILAAKMMT